MQHDNTNRGRENLVAVVLAVLGGAAVFGFLFLIGGGYFLSMLLTVAAVALLGVGHYFVWGRSMRRQAVERPRTPPHPRDQRR